MQTKLFIGTRVTPDLKACLDTLLEGGLKQIPFEGKEYIGVYLPSARPNVGEVRSQYQQLIDSLQVHLPDVRVDTFPVVVFPQLFLG